MQQTSAKQFSLLAKLTHEFATTQDIDHSLSSALEDIADMVGAEAGSIWLLSKDKKILKCRASFGGSNITGLEIPSEQGVVGNVVQYRTATTADSSDPNFTSHVDNQTGFTTISMATAPIIIGEACLGAVQLLNATTPSQRFAEHNLETLEILSGTAGLALKNAQLTADLIEQERIKQEVLLARSVQQSILDLEPPLDGSIAGENIAAREVSGDFFSVSEFSPGVVHFCIADVSGKGAHAGILMARVATLWRAFSKQNMPTTAVLEKINNEIFETNYRGMFCTIIAGTKINNHIEFAIAGHEPVLHYCDEKFVEYVSAHPPLGVQLWKNPLPVHTIDLSKGPVYMYSDGVTDGITNSGVELTLDGLKNTITEIATLPPEIQTAAITRRVSFNEAKLRDDVTILVFGKTS